MNKAFLSAYHKGAAARLAGLPSSACPYEDIRNNYRRGNTFSRAFRHYWQYGWDRPHANPAQVRILAPD